MENLHALNIDNNNSLSTGEEFPIEDFISEIDPSDVVTAMDSSSKPQAQSKSKHAFPFGVQISTPRTYCVF